MDKKIIIIYYSRSGNTEKMAQAVREGVEKEGVPVTCKRVEKVKVRELLQYDGIIIGSPTYYGSMAYQIKKLLDESVQFHGELAGKVGGAFSSAANIGGGNETTILDILKGLLIHGMIVQGAPQGDHYGPVAIGAPNQKAKTQCQKLGQRIAQLVKKL
jgi:NAD(P)H dehydrogenase (quinone)